MISSEPIIINESNHILINGESGSGKTTLLYILKGIIKPDSIEILPDIKNINYHIKKYGYLKKQYYNKLYSFFIRNRAFPPTIW